MNEVTPVTEDEIEQLADDLAKLDPPWVLTTATPMRYEATRGVGTVPLIAAAISPRALRNAINAQERSYAASKDGYEADAPQIIRGVVNTENN
jgi:hypothetical protein